MIKKIVFLGDSITDAGHLWTSDEFPLGEGYVSFLSSRLAQACPGIEVINKGQDGFTSADVRRTLKTNCLNLQPDAVSLLIGINDIAVTKVNGLSLKESGFAENLHAVLSALSEQGISKIFCMGPFLFPCPQEYLTWLPDIALAESLFEKEVSRFGLPFLPLQKPLNKFARLHGFPHVTTDGVHLTFAGHAFLAKLWSEAFL